MKNIFDYLKNRNNKLIERNNLSETIELKDTPFDYEDYDNVEIRNSNEQIEGMHYKKFVRFPKEYFNDLIEEVRNNSNCSYKTYLEDAIKDDESTPKFLSVMLKYMGKADINSDELNTEILASRLCNFFQIPTVFNKKYIKDGSKYLLSVDFLPYGKKIINMEDEVAEIEVENFYDFGNFMEFENSYNFIPNQLCKLYDVETMNKHWLYDKKEYRKKFVEYSFFRKWVLKDLDFFPRNFCNIIDKNTNEIEIAPMFDFECCFATNHLFDDELCKEFEYLQDAHKDILDKLFVKFNELFNSDNLQTIFKDISDKKFIDKKTEELKESFQMLYNQSQLTK